MGLISRQDLKDRIISLNEQITELDEKLDTLKKFGCSKRAYADALQDAIAISISTPTTTAINDSSGLAWHKYDYATISAPVEPKDTKVLFSCPCCGTHYLASDPGFIPNCHNCGAVMRKD